MSSHEVIKAAREKAGLSQTMLAQRVGVTRAAVQQWERPDGTAPKLDRLAKVAAELGITQQEIIGEEPAPFTIPRGGTELGEVLRRLSDQLGRTDAATRETAAALLQTLAKNPSSSDSVITALEAILGGGRPPVETISKGAAK